MGRAFLVTIDIPGALRQYCGGKDQLTTAARTVREAIESLEKSQPALYPNICDETGAVRRHLNVFVNTSNIRDLAGIDTELTGGEEITILPAVSGG